MIQYAIFNLVFHLVFHLLRAVAKPGEPVNGQDAVQEKIASKRTTLVEESELTHVAAPDNPTKEFENRQERFALYRAMQQLDAETREVIHLRLAGDFSFRDIGDILGHSEVWARVRFYRGKEKLVKIIGGDNNA